MTETVEELTFPVSATLEVNERVAARRRAGEDIVHLAFGEAGLPVPPVVRRALAAAADLNSYGPVDGDVGLRTAAAGWFTRRGLPTDAKAIFATPGSKAALFALLRALPGDVVLPRPAWVSYAPQARLLGKQVIAHPIPAIAGGVPDPAGLGEALEVHRSRGFDPGILVLTIPDNPTGTYPPADLAARVVELADREGLTIVVDEIYRDLAYDPGDVPSVASLAPELTFVTTGLSKALALGGWRFGLVRVPDNDLGHRTRLRLHAIASEVWSCVPAPIAAAARVAYEEPPELISYVDDARAAHRTLCTAVYEIVNRVGLSCRPPQAAFYLYPSVPVEAARHSSDLDAARNLLDRHGIAVLPGSAFGDDPASFSFRLATSLLCGVDDDERWETLRAAREGTLMSLPRISGLLDRIETGLRALVGR
jgi:aspartate aminotransferase